MARYSIICIDLFHHKLTICFTHLNVFSSSISAGTEKKGRQISQDRSFQPFKKPSTDTTVFSELHTLNIFLP